MKKSSSTLKIFLCILGGILISLCSFWAGFLVKSATIDDDAETINYILSMYKQYYYEELESDQIIDIFTSSLLDDYSDYYSAEEMELIYKASQGSHQGIGINYDGYTNTIVNVSWNSPADRAGVLAGGVVTGYKMSDGQVVSILAQNKGGDADSLSNALSQVPVDTDFSLVVDYSGEELQFLVRREEYTETFVRYYDNSGEYGFRTVDGEMIFERIGNNNRYDLNGNNSIGVIDYNGFDGVLEGDWGSSGQFKTALSKFKENGKTKLILDLRDNGGGYVDIMCSVASHLVNVENGSEVPAIVVKDKYENTEIYNTTPVDYADYNFSGIVVLANDWSASASEALIGAMLDYDPNNIVKVVLEESQYEPGVYKTYGKGIMQRTFPNLLKGDAVKLTVAKLFWPTSNLTIHGVGVTTNLNESFSQTKIYNESAKNSCVSQAVQLLK